MEFWNTRYYQNEPVFTGDDSRSNLTKIKDMTYLVNLDEDKSIGTHWVVFYVKMI